MLVLLDTCTVLMLIRMVPDMFVDAKYECVTINEVRDEIFQTQKFKDKYPWRTDYKSKIIPDTSILKKDDNFNLVYSVIQNQIYNGTTNRRAGRYIDLSRVDQNVASFAVANNLTISSTDSDLIFFLKQEFNIKNLYPLEIINAWLKNEILVWNDELHKILREWSIDEEPEQPQGAKKEFEKITGYRFI